MPPVPEASEPDYLVREARITVLENAYNARRYFDNESRAPHRFCAVWKEDRQTSRQCWATFADFDEAAAHLAGDVLDGGIFEAIFDLDTGERIDLHVSTPIVTRAEDQGLIINPLQPDEDDPQPIVVVRFVAHVTVPLRAAVESMLLKISDSEDVKVILGTSYPPVGPPESFIDPATPDPNPRVSYS